MGTVIIGAGPAGLSLAIQLKKRGVKDVIVYDAREGQYLRPGVLNADVFRKAGVPVEKEFEDEENLQDPYAQTSAPQFEYEEDFINPYEAKEPSPQSEYNPYAQQETTPELSSEKPNPRHIKELERELYKRAEEEGVQFESNNFVKLYQHPEKPGIIINQDGKEVKVEADYVFDCTGSKRAVVNSLNSIIPDSPMKLTKFADVPVPNQFLAYVNMAKESLDNLETLTDDDAVNSMSDLSFTLAMDKLHKKGWDKWKFPRVIAHDFSKNKVCLYLQTPKDLDKNQSETDMVSTDHTSLNENQYDAWLEAVMVSYKADYPEKQINYEHLPLKESKEASENESKEKSKAELKQKLRFKPFTIGAQALEQSGYKGTNLPMVVALGDAQIDSDYILGVGISDGLDRLEGLLNSLTIENGSITSLDLTQFHTDISDDMIEHKMFMIDEINRLNRSFERAKTLARQRFINVLISSTSDENKDIAMELLQELVGKNPVDIFAINIELAEAFFKAKDYNLSITYGREALSLQKVLASNVENKLPDILNTLINAFYEEAKRVMSTNPAEAQSLYSQAKDLFEIHSDDLEEAQKSHLSGQLDQLDRSIQSQIKIAEKKPQEHSKLPDSARMQNYSNQRLFKNKKDDDNKAEDHCSCTVS